MSEQNKDKNQEYERNRTLSEIEAAWYKEVSEYLYDASGNYKGYVKAYKDYNDNTPAILDPKSREDSFMINDIYLSIPPSSISFSQESRHLDMPYIRGKSAVKIDTGQAEMSITITVAFTDDLMTGRKLEDELKYKLIPLLTQLETIPFCHVRNKYLSSRLLNLAMPDTIVNSDATFRSYDEIMLTYTGHSIAPDPESPRSVNAAFSFLVFNYLPFMTAVAFAYNYQRQNGILVKDENGLLPDPGAVFSLADSRAFYEFMALEYKNRERRATQCGLSLMNYQHSAPVEEITLKWKEYYEYERTAENTDIIKNKRSGTTKVVLEPGYDFKGAKTRGNVPDNAAIARNDAKNNKEDQIETEESEEVPTNQTDASAGTVQSQQRGNRNVTIKSQIPEYVNAENQIPLPDKQREQLVDGAQYIVVGGKTLDACSGAFWYMDEALAEKRARAAGKDYKVKHIENYAKFTIAEYHRNVMYKGPNGMPGKLSFEAINGDAAIDAREFIEECMSWLGTPYLHGGTQFKNRGGGKGKGVDCSGFTQEVFGKFGLRLSGESKWQLVSPIGYFVPVPESHDSEEWGTRFKFGDILAIEVVREGNINPKSPGGHVVIYLGHNTFIESRGDKGVIITTLKTNDQWNSFKKSCTGGRRLLRFVNIPQNLDQYLGMDRNKDTTAHTFTVSSTSRSTNENIIAVRNIVRHAESGGKYDADNGRGFHGAYQFGGDALWDLGVSLQGYVPKSQGGNRFNTVKTAEELKSKFPNKEYVSFEDFYKSKDSQDNLFVHHVHRLMKNIVDDIKNGKYVLTRDNFHKHGFTMSSIVGGYYLCPEWAINYFKTGKTDAKDSFGTDLMSVMKLWSGFQIFDGSIEILKGSPMDIASVEEYTKNNGNGYKSSTKTKWNTTSGNGSTVYIGKGSNVDVSLSVFAVESTSENKDYSDIFKYEDDAGMPGEAVDYDYDDFKTKSQRSFRFTLDTIVDGLPTDRWRTVATEKESIVGYIQVDKEYTFRLNESGAVLTSIVCDGVVNIPRIQLSGYKYPTHQYMGGHIRKASLDFVFVGTQGHSILSTIQYIADTVSHNAMHYKAFAAFDGIEVHHRFLNVVHGGIRYYVDGIPIQTGSAPNESLASIQMIDVTGMREQVEKINEFDLSRGRKKEGINKLILHTVLKEYGAFFNMEYRVIKMKLPAAAKDGVDSYAEFQHNLHVFMNFNNIYEANGNLKKGEVFTALEELKNRVALIDPVRWPSGMFDEYELASIIKCYKYPENNRPPFSFEAPTYKYEIRPNAPKNLKSFLASDKNGHEFNMILNDWLSMNKHILIRNIPKLRDIMPNEEAVASFDQFEAPAYQDFNLPPTLNPDYYFYQPKKYLTVSNTQGISSRKSKFVTSYKKKYQSYIRQIDATRFFKQGDISDNNILKQLCNKNEEIADMGQNSAFRTCANNITRVYPSEASIEVYGAAGSEIYGEKGEEKFIRSSSKDELGAMGVVSSGEGTNVETGSSLWKSIYYGNPGSKETYITEVTKERQIEQLNKSAEFSMLHCFPAYKVFIIEEDTTEVGAFRRANDLNEIYGMNCVQSIQFADQIDNPISTCVIDIVDITGRFSSAKYKPRPVENKKPENRDTKNENLLEGIMLTEGSSIMVKAGYGNNINTLPTIFCGEIASMSGEINEFSLICQSYGAELTKDVIGTAGPIDIGTFNSETKEIFDFILNHPNVKHFGRWKLRSSDYLQFTDGRFGITPGMYTKTRPDGSSQLVWSWHKQFEDINILAPDESKWDGLDDLVEQIAQDGVLGVIGSLTAFLNPGDWFVSFVAHNATLWDIAREMQHRYPGYALKPIPYGDRMTLYFGPLDSMYYYRPFTEWERIQIAKASDGEKIYGYVYGEDISTDERKRIEQELAEAEKKLMTVQTRKTGEGYEMRSDDDPLVVSAQQEVKRLKNILDKKYRAKTLGREYIRGRTIRRFKNYWIAASDKNIMHNLIKADYRDVYNLVRITYAEAGVGDKDNLTDYNQLDWASGTSDIKMNDFLREEDLRTVAVQAPNAILEAGAIRYAAQILLENAWKLYKGSLIMLGNPEIKPYDTIMVFDDSLRMTGPINVVQHVLRITANDGMVSDITPGMSATVNEMVHLTFMDVVAGNYADVKNEDALERAQNTYLPITAMATSVVSAARAVTMTGSIFTGFAAATPLTAVLTAASSLVWANLALTCVNLAKSREPIFLKPMMKDGVPYIYGMNSYKVGGIVQWIENEWHMFTDGLDKYFDMIGIGISEIFDSEYGRE